MDWSRTAFALSGGGSKGAYIVGVLRYLWDNHRESVRKAPSVFGSSTGALIAVKWALALMTGDSRHVNEIEHIYRTVTQESLLKPNFSFSDLNYWDLILGRKNHLFEHLSFYDSSPLQELLDTYIVGSDWDLLTSSGAVEIGFPIVALESGHGEVVSSIAYPQADLLRRAVLASASVPVLMPPVQVFPERGKFVDGCFVAFNPIDVLHHSKVVNNLDYVLAISTDDYEFSSVTMLSDVITAIASEVGIDSKDKARRMVRLIRWLTHRKPLIPQLIWDVLDEKKVIQLLDMATEDLKDFDVRTIHPEVPLLGNPFSFTQPAMSNLVDQGMADAQKQIPKLLVNKSST